MILKRLGLWATGFSAWKTFVLFSLEDKRRSDVALFHVRTLSILKYNLNEMCVRGTSVREVLSGVGMHNWWG